MKNYVPHSITGITCYKDDQIIETMLNNQVDYLSYRIFVESVPGRSHGAKYVYLRDIQMFGKTPTGNQCRRKIYKKKKSIKNGKIRGKSIIISRRVGEYRRSVLVGGWDMNGRES